MGIFTVCSDPGFADVKIHGLNVNQSSRNNLNFDSSMLFQSGHQCPPVSRIFQGRKDILAKMHHFFTSNMGNQHIYVLHGLGGAGKIQITLKFISESSSHFSDIFFIDASTIVTIEAGLKNIAVAKKIGDSPQDGLLWLTSKVEEWLLVFDNADNPNINLNDFLPQSNHGNIIITSRNPGLHALHYFPLAIVQAGAFISKSQDLGGYLALYTKHQTKLLSEKPAQSHDHYVWTIYTTWQMSFEQLQPPAAMFLQHCSFLHYNGISEEIFNYAARYRVQSNSPSKEELQAPLVFLSQFLGPTSEWDSLKFLEVTNDLQAYSLLSFDAEKKLFSIHPLVHAWSQTTVCNPERYMSTMGSILGMALSERPHYNIQLGGLALCPHVELAIQMNTKIALAFRMQYGHIFAEAGIYKQYEKLLKQIREEQKQLLGDDHLDTLHTMGNLARTYSVLGEHQKAKALKVTVLKKQTQLLGENHPATLHTIGNLACTYSDMGEHEKAKHLKVIVLEKQKQCLGDNHPDTLRTMGNLANTYSHLGEHQEAEQLNLSVLGKQKEVLGNSHPYTLHTMGGLAYTYSHLGEHQKAKKLNLSVLEKQKQFLGDHHPDTLLTIGNLASTYSALGEHQKAEELKVTVLEKQEVCVGGQP
ncbi:hypothetical protein K438DRAFT_1920268 [Mycena galopus ATCC 62051]|nr:hypothetical protein K438DRAFT_1920268 [Mycena galopus ATCC 62051]